MIVIAENDKSRAALREHRTNFYASIGRCLIAYQTLEDILPNVFAAALGGDVNRADAIFKIARGLEAKLDIITAALITADAPHRSNWGILVRRIASAAEARNQIAHSVAVYRSEMILDDELEEGVSGELEPAVRHIIELRKRNRKGEAVWTGEMMLEEALKMSTLVDYLMGFTMDLRGTPIPGYIIDPEAPSA